jgi:hypothetical protein
MDDYLQSVMRCLTANGETFVAHEYPVEGGWNPPDFVALRPRKRTVYVVAVSAADNLFQLVKKVVTRDEQWLAKLAPQLSRLKLVGLGWRYQVLVFIQEEQMRWFRKKVGSPKDVTILSLEQAMEHWRWDPKVWTAGFSFETDALRRVTQ